MSQARRWLPGREMVVIGDSAFATLEFLAAAGRHRVTCVTRLRLDAAFYDLEQKPSNLNQKGFPDAGEM